MENTNVPEVKMPITYDDLKQSLIDSGRPYDFTMIDRAYALAEKAHGEQRRRDDRQQEHRRGAHTTVQRVRWQRERYRAGGADAEIVHDAPLLHAELIHCGQHDARRQQTDGEGQRRN